MKILGIESSCDETAAAVVEAENGSLKILSNVVASQIEMHRLWGGVVPELAGRAHIEKISEVCHSALDDAQCTLKDIDAIAVTSSPGLIGALLVGVNFAKCLAYSHNIPLVPVEHVHAHLCAAALLERAPKPPFAALAVSGGHTAIYMGESFTDFIARILERKITEEEREMLFAKKPFETGSVSEKTEEEDEGK